MNDKILTRSLALARKLMPEAKQVVQGAYDQSEAYAASLQFRTSLSRITFLAFVILPALGASLYYGLLASPRYVSEAQFIVRSMSGQRASGIEMLLRTFGMARTVDDAYAVQKYLQSRDIVVALAKRGYSVQAIFGGDRGDFWSRYPYFWRADSDEARFDYFLDRIQLVEDSVKGITTLRVITFDAQTSQKLAREMVKLAEEMINRMNERAQEDILKFAIAEVRIAEQAIVETQTALARFRNASLMLDPSKSSVGILDTIALLNADVAFASAQLKELLTSSPANPAIPSLRAKIATLEDRVRIERSKLAGGDGALSDKIADYEQLALRRELAERSLASAIKSLDFARQEARRQHIYIEEVVSPHVADESTEPRRLRAVFTVLVFGFGLFAITWIISVGAGEHAG